MLQAVILNASRRPPRPGCGALFRKAATRKPTEAHRPETLNPKPYSSNLKFETLNPKPAAYWQKAQPLIKREARMPWQGFTNYREPKSIGRSETSPWDLGAHPEVHTHRGGVGSSRVVWSRGGIEGIRIGTSDRFGRGRGEL